MEARISKIITIIAIALGIILAAIMAVQMMVDQTSRHVNGWEKATAGYVQEGNHE